MNEPQLYVIIFVAASLFLMMPLMTSIGEHAECFENSLLISEDFIRM